MMITFANTVKLGKFGGIFCLMSEAWALVKTLLWPLCKLLSSYREYDTGVNSVVAKRRIS